MSSPTPLPITRAQALERWREWHCGETAASGAEEDMAALAAAWGITFAPEPPAPPARKWPAKLVAVKPYSHWKCMATEDEDWWFTVSHTSLEDEDLTKELARRWSRCEELELNIEEGWRRSAQIDRGIIEEQRERIDAPLAELAERTRERDDSLIGLERISDLYVRCGQELDKARAERDELRRRCASVATRVDWLARVDGPLSNDKPNTAECLREAANDLRGTRPVPGEGGGDA